MMIVPSPTCSRGWVPTLQRDRKPLRERLLALTLTWLLAWAPGLATASDIRFTHLTSADGLSQASVQSILQDRHGFMWFGTQEGLNRYDGYEVVVFAHDPEDAQSLPNNWIWALHEDRAGSLWIGTDGGGLARLDAATGRFTRFVHRADDGTSLPADIVRDIVEDDDGNLWIGTDGGGLARLEPDKGRITRLADLEAGSALADDRVRALHRDASGHIWIGTDGGGVDRLDPATGRVVHLTYAGARRADARVRSLVTYGNELWIGTYEGGVLRYDLEQGGVTRFTHDPANAASLSGDSVRELFVDERGDLWVGTDGAGINRFDARTGTFQRYRHITGDPDSLSGDNAVALWQDRGGVIWVGTYAGVSRWNPILGSFGTVRRWGEGPTDLSSDYVQSLAEAEDGSIWIGTYGGGLNRWNPGRTSFAHWHHDPNDSTSLSDDRVFALAAGQGGVWVGTRGDGVNFFDPATNRFTRYSADPARSDALSAPGVTSLLLDRRGRLWVGTYQGGLNRLDDAKVDRFVHFRADDGANGLCSDRVLALLEDASGTIWVGTFGGGICRFNAATGGFTSYRNDPADPNSLSSDRAWALHEDAAGDLWISTQDGGLNRWRAADRKAGRASFERYAAASGVAGGAIFAALSDAAGKVWFSTSRGLGRLDPGTGEVRMYDVTHGLQGNEFNHGAFAQTQRGELMFGGTAGFNVFDPLAIGVNERPPQVGFTRLSRLSRTLPLSVAEPGAQPLSFTYRDVLIGFEYAAFDYSAPQRNRYRHRLVGFDDGWSTASASRSATFTNLAPGNYRFEVIGSNNDGIWSEQPLALSFTVLPAPWATAWARVGYVALALLLIALIYRSQARRIAVAAQIHTVNEALRHEISERQSQQRALEIAKERAQTYLDVAEVIILSLDGSGQIRLVNQKAVRVLGLSEADLIGRNFYEFVPEDVRTEVRERFAKVGEYAYSESPVLLADGTQRMIAWHTTTLPASGDGSGELLISGMDVTQVRSLERQVRDSQKMEALGTLARGIAHDFNNILSAILGFSELSRAEVAAGSRAARYLQRLEVSVQRARNLVQAILTFGRQVRQDPVPTRLQIVVREALQLLRATVPSSVEIRTNLAAAAAPVMADPSQLHQLVMNLATNACHAVRAIDDAIVTLTVANLEIDAESARSRPNLAPGSYVAFSVSDNGEGMEAATLARVFEPFFTTKGPGEGSGLGLSVVHGIVTQLGGEINVRSRPGEGTQVRVLLPACAEPPPQTDVQRARPPLPHGSETILFVDDEPAITSIGRDMLERLGYRVVVAADGPHALSELDRRGGEVDLLITDLTMPVMLGYELARRVRVLHPDLPVVLMSGARNNGDDDAPFAGFLAKPFTLEELAAMVRTTLDSRSTRRVR
jgi:PAS domain S-box-containing protein